MDKELKSECEVRDIVFSLLEQGVNPSDIIQYCWAHTYIHPTDDKYKDIIKAYRILEDALKIIKKERGIDETFVPPPLPR